MRVRKKGNQNQGVKGGRGRSKERKKYRDRQLERERDRVGGEYYIHYIFHRLTINIPRR